MCLRDTELGTIFKWWSAFFTDTLGRLHSVIQYNKQDEETFNKQCNNIRIAEIWTKMYVLDITYYTMQEMVLCKQKYNTMREREKQIATDTTLQSTVTSTILYMKMPSWIILL